MATAISGEPRVLVLKRAFENRIHACILVGLTFLTVLPFLVGAGYAAATSIVAGPPASSGRQLTELVVLFSLVQMAALGVLFRAFAASPAAQLLAESGASPAGPNERETRDLLRNLAVLAGLPAPRLFVIDCSVPNAFSVSAGLQEPVVAVTRGALTMLDRKEMEALLAHELSHIGNRDGQLNTVVAAIALFLRIPFLLFQQRPEGGNELFAGRRNPWLLALSPITIHILIVSPLVAALIRAAVSQDREFEADADAAKLTGALQSLLRALAKIGGSGAVLPECNPAFAHFYFACPAAPGGWLGGNLAASHPPVVERIHMLAVGHDPAAVENLMEAVKVGRRYTREHPVAQSYSLGVGGKQEKLTSANRGGNRGMVMGRVYRLMSVAPVPVYETPNRGAPVMVRLNPGALLVVFDDPGKMRQVNTAEQTFGYLDRSVKLTLMDALVPEQVYDPAARAAAEAALPPLPALHPVTVLAPVRPAQTLTTHQILMAVGLGVLVFGGMFLALVKFGS